MGGLATGLLVLIAGVGTGTAAGTAGASEASGKQACDSWIVEYELIGQFDIRNTPFNAWDCTNDIGPGRVRLRVPDVNGAPGPGEVQLLSYQHRLAFATSDVTTDMTVVVQPNPCGVATGKLRGGRLTWRSKVPGYRTAGKVTCTVNPLVCALGLLPYNKPVTRDSTHAQRFSDFVFAGDGTMKMDWMQVPNKDKGTSFIRLNGVEVSRQCSPPPACP